MNTSTVEANSSIIEITTAIPGRSAYAPLSGNPPIVTRVWVVGLPRASRRWPQAIYPAIVADKLKCELQCRGLISDRGGAMARLSLHRLWVGFV